MTKTFWDLAGSHFTAAGEAQNTWNILKTNKRMCLLQRVKDNKKVWLDTATVIRRVNGL